jgi:hypothetical protein
MYKPVLHISHGPTILQKRVDTLQEGTKCSIQITNDMDGQSIVVEDDEEEATIRKQFDEI